MRIDCSECEMYRSRHCEDCLVTALLYPPQQPVESHAPGERQADVEGPQQAKDRAKQRDIVPAATRGGRVAAHRHQRTSLPCRARSAVARQGCVARGELGNVGLEMRSDRAPHPTLRVRVGHPVAPDEHLLVGERQTGDLTDAGHVAEDCEAAELVGIA